MTDFERQLRDALRTAVADAQPPPAVMAAVRRRYRRRNIWLAAVSVVTIALLASAIPIARALRGGGGQPANGRSSAAPLFPGGGRLLLDVHGVLEWFYPDGQKVRIASGIAGAALRNGKLLAWKRANPPGASRFLPRGCSDPSCTAIHDLSYYTMNLDGSDARLILPAKSPVGSIAFQYEGAQLSPGGSRLAYISQELRIGTGSVLLERCELWSLDLATGRRTDLGPYSSYAPFAWKDNTTILADSANGRSIRLINATDGYATTYLTIADRSLIRAYRQARPGTGPLSSVSLAGWNPGTSNLALSLTGRTRDGASMGRPVEIPLDQDRVLAFAPGASPWISLSTTWGPHGLFVLDSRSNKPCGLTRQIMYAGAAPGERLSRVRTIQQTWNAAAVNHQGTVIALAESAFIDFVPVPPPACDAAGKCVHFGEKQFFEPAFVGGVKLLAWDRG